MSLIHWDNTLSIGIKTVDDQHKRLVEIMNKLNDALEQGMANDVLGEVLECSVCFHQLDTTAKVLPCQHTFCYGCLNDIARSHKV